MAGTTMEDLVLNKTNYSRLDETASRVRIRLQTPCVKLRHLGAPATAKTVEATYLQGNRLKTVTAGRMVIACWHREIPLLCEEIGEAQKIRRDNRSLSPFNARQRFLLRTLVGGPIEVLTRRVTGRHGDASDATAAQCSNRSGQQIPCFGRINRAILPGLP